MTDQKIERFRTISEIVRAARQSLPPQWWDHTAGGTGTETTIRRNRQMMETYAFRPRLMQGPGIPDMTTSIFGIELASPIMFAPVGSIHFFSARQALGPAAVAARRNLLFFNGIFTAPHLSEVGAEAPGRCAMQLYIRGDRGWITETVRAAEAGGYVALCVTIDSIGGGTRDRDLLNGFVGLTDISPPNTPPFQQGIGGQEFQLQFTWDDFSWLRSITELPIALKGITTTDDAVEAVRRGANVVYVSNHGGRGLDSLPATIEVLPEIVDAVDGGADVIVDSGFLRGTDIVKAVALGAKAVAIGKLQAWSLAAGDEGGLERVVDLLEKEIGETMQLLGAKRIADLTRETLRASTPTRYQVADLNRYEYAPIQRL